MTLSVSLSELEGAVERGFAAAAQRPEEKNPVLEAVIAGLDVIKKKTRGFDYKVITEDNEGYPLEGTTLRTTLKEPMQNIYVSDEGRISLSYGHGIKQNPQKADILKLVENVAKLAEEARPSPKPGFIAYLDGDR